MGVALDGEDGRENKGEGITEHTEVEHESNFDANLEEREGRREGRGREQRARKNWGRRRAESEKKTQPLNESSS